MTQKSNIRTKNKSSSLKLENPTLSLSLTVNLQNRETSYALKALSSKPQTRKTSLNRGVGGHRALETAVGHAFPGGLGVRVRIIIDSLLGREVWAWDVG